MAHGPCRYTNTHAHTHARAQAAQDGRTCTRTNTHACMHAGVRKQRTHTLLSDAAATRVGSALRARASAAATRRAERGRRERG